MQAERGVIKNRSYARQINNFSGLRYGTITPTDLDVCLEFHGKLFIFGEIKYGGAVVPRGQMVFLERLCKAMHQKPLRYCFGVIADHHHAPTEDIDTHDAIVRAIWQNGRFMQPMTPGLTVRAAVDRMVSYVEKQEGITLWHRPQMVKVA